MSDHSESSIDDTSTHRDKAPGGDGSPEHPQVIAQTQTKNVNRLRFVVCVTMVLSMIGVSLAIYFFARRAETRAFAISYDDDANKVLDAIGGSIDLTLGAMDSFASNLVSVARVSNQSWPYVLIPDFAYRASKVRALTRCSFLNIYMLILDEERDLWQNFTSQNNGWIDSDIEVMRTDPNYFGKSEGEYELWDVIHDNSEYEKGEDEIGIIGSDRKEVYFPLWQQYPIAPYSFPPYNWDLHSGVDISTVDKMRSNFKTILSRPYLLPNLTDPVDVENNEYEVEWFSDFLRPEDDETEPAGDIYYPIFDTLTDVQLDPKLRSNATFRGILSFTIRWREYIVDILPESDLVALQIVFNSSCAPTFTYSIVGGHVSYLGRGDQHESRFTHMEKSTSLVDLDQFATRQLTYSGVPLDETFCPMTVHIFPTTEMEEKFVTSSPLFFAIAAFSIFGLTVLTFALYALFVERRQKVVLQTAVESNQVVSNLFPSTVRDRVIKDAIAVKGDDAAIDNDNRDGNPGRPNAELYYDCTILFMDIAGFTAWSSKRTPEQVFTLLETLYGAFDGVARQRKVFKVETIGDSYMAATGVPRPQKNHASTMVRFAVDCRDLTRTHTHQLAETLGEDTRDLKIRIGMHSGSVTAGVLRGDKSRFQLFGDTVNTASRMESTGVVDRIQVSQSTADYLRQDGKDNWLSEREDLVEAKGKGHLQTFFAECKTRGPSTVSSSMSAGSVGRGSEVTSPVIARLIDWNVDLFKTILERLANQQSPQGGYRLETNQPSTPTLAVHEISKTLPMSPRLSADSTTDSTSRCLPSVVYDQLRSYITAIAYLHRGTNTFHNFEHASQAALMTSKLWHRLSTKFELSRCPLTELACLLAALVQDVDHRGCPNECLIREGHNMAVLYDKKSIAEQNAFDLAWNLLMDEKYTTLQSFVLRNNEEKTYFRQVLVNTIMATDVSDTDVNDSFDKRWSEAFPHNSAGTTRGSGTESSRRSLSLELIVKASGIGHTMQPWAIYSKWAKRAYQESQDSESLLGSSTTWVDEEKAAFASHFVPLAEKIESCGLFNQPQEFKEHAQENQQRLLKQPGSLVHDALM